MGNITYWNPNKKASNKTDGIYIGEYQQNNDKEGHQFMTYEYKAELK